ncbi:MAG TPA: DUF6152 family protein [Steroidobacteraceae bacterium]|nr:DUF6152 family protein [Steroidobacteraceae bacterium]
MNTLTGQRQRGRRCRRAVLASVALLVGGAVAGLAQAHHSVARYDLSDKVRRNVSGTVTKLEWQNPHSWFFIDVTGPDGMPVNWSIELSSPGALRRTGLNYDSIKPGDQVTVELAPIKDGRNAGLAVAIKWADGHEWRPTGQASPLPPAGQQGPGQQAPGQQGPGAPDAGTP